MSHSSTRPTSSPLPSIYGWFSALMMGDFKAMEHLMQQGLTVDIRHPLRHTTALMEATRLGRTEVIQWLLDHGASPALLNGMPQGTALHCALRRKYWEIAQLLTAATPNPGIADSFGNTPLHTICMESQAEEDLTHAMDAINILVGKGCAVDTLNHEGLSALHYTALSDSQHLLELMLVHGANPNSATPDEGATPLMLAAVEHNMGLCAILLQHGADVHLRNREGVSAADMFPALTKLDMHAIYTSPPRPLSVPIQPPHKVH